MIRLAALFAVLTMSAASVADLLPWATFTELPEEQRIGLDAIRSAACETLRRDEVDLPIAEGLYLVMVRCANPPYACELSSAEASNYYLCPAVEFGRNLDGIVFASRRPTVELATWYRTVLNGRLYEHKTPDAEAVFLPSDVPGFVWGKHWKPESYVMIRRASGLLQRAGYQTVVEFGLGAP